jgi:hypothetical protein
MYCAKHFKEKTVLGPSFLAEEVSQGRDYKKFPRKFPICLLLSSRTGSLLPAEK